MDLKSIVVKAPFILNLSPKEVEEYGLSKSSYSFIAGRYDGLPAFIADHPYVVANSTEAAPLVPGGLVVSQAPATAGLLGNTPDADGGAVQPSGQMPAVPKDNAGTEPREPTGIPGQGDKPSDLPPTEPAKAPQTSPPTGEQATAGGDGATGGDNGTADANKTDDSKTADAGKLEEKATADGNKTADDGKTPVDPDVMTRAALLALAEEEGAETNSGMTKAEIAAAINAKRGV